MDPADGEIAHWTMCGLLRNGGISRITGHSLRHCDRSALGSARASCRSVEAWAASLLVESNTVVGRKSAGDVLHLRSRNTKSEPAGPRAYRKGDGPCTSCD